MPAPADLLAASSRTALVVFCCLLAALSAWGWGRLVARRTGLVDLPAPWMAAFGLAVVVAIGGALNLLSIARPLVLYGLLLAGVLLAADAIRRDLAGRLGSGGRLFERRLLYWLLPTLLLLVFLAWNLAPPDVLNRQDDFEKYLTHPRRMIETGSVAGSLFGAVGTETLGAMAYLQGFVASLAGLPMVAAVDAVFALALLLAMVGSAAVRFALPGWLLALLLAATAALNPQAVNVTAIYLGAVFLVLLLGAPLLLAEDGPVFSPWTGVVAAALLALKTSFALAVVVALAILAAGAVIAPDRKKALAGAGRSLAVFCAALLPWLAVAVLWRQLGRSPELASAPPLPAGAPAEVFDPWVTVPIFHGFGETWLHYSVLVLATAGLLALAAAWAGGTARRSAIVAWLGSGPLLAGVLVPFFSVSGLGFDATLRYLAPALLASVVGGLLALAAPPGAGAGPWAAAGPKVRLAFAAGFAVLVIGLFAESAGQRFRQMVDHRNHYAAGATVQAPWYRARVAAALDEAASPGIVRALHSIPPGETVLAATPLAFRLSHRHHVIHELNPWFLLVPWLARPASDDLAGWRRLLAQTGTHYLLLQYRGAGVWNASTLRSQLDGSYAQDRLFASRMLAFGGVLEALAGEGEIVYRDDLFVVARLRR